jgi:hypothetical protein
MTQIRRLVDGVGRALFGVKRSRERGSRMRILGMRRIVRRVLRGCWDQGVDVIVGSWVECRNVRIWAFIEADSLM